MRAISLCLALIQFTAPIYATCASAGDFSNVQRGATTPLPVATAVVLADPGLAYYETLVHTNPLRGGFGEAHMSRFMSRQLRAAERLQPLTARLGPQGIDGLFVGFNEDGKPNALVVAEAKYGGAALGWTRDGIQMGRDWRATRLRTLATAYREAGQQATQRLALVEPMDAQSRPLRLEIRMPDGKAAVYWRRNTSELWKFAGRESELGPSGERMQLIAKYLDECADGVTPYKAIVWRVNVRGNTVSWIAKDASALARDGVEAGLPVVKSGALNLNSVELASLKRIGTNEIAEILLRKEPLLTVAESRQIAERISSRSQSLQHTLTSDHARAQWRVARASAATGLIAATIDMSITAIGDYWQHGTLEADLIAKRGGVALVAGGAGTYLGQQATIAVLKNAAANSSRGVGGPTSTLMFTAQGTGIAAGGSVASLIMAYGSYFAGLSDLKGANQIAAAGIASSMVVGAAYTGTMALIAAYGTASTGTAIGALTGAAATNASLAVLGGGTIAAGGLGAAGGAVVLSGGLAIIGIAVGFAVIKSFSYFDEKADMSRIAMTVERLDRKTHLVPAQ